MSPEKQLFLLLCQFILVCLILVYGIAVPLGKSKQATKLIEDLLKQFGRWLKKTHLCFWNKDWKVTLVIEFFILVFVILVLNS